LTAALGLIGFGLLIWGVWPSRRLEQVLSASVTDGTRAGAPADAHGSQSGTPDRVQYRVTLEYPQWLRAGDSGLVRLHVVATHIPLAEDPADVLDVGQGQQSGMYHDSAGLPAIQARLELSDAAVSPAGDISAPWSPPQAASFLWTVQGMRGAAARGTAWTFLLRSVSLDLSGERSAISAQPLEIRTRTLLGITGPAARFSGAALLILGTVLGMPDLEHLLRRGFRR
jgi:hypothetical protein